MLRVSAGFQQAFQQLGLTSCESVVRHFMGRGARTPSSARSASGETADEGVRAPMPEFIGGETARAAVVVRPATLKLADNSTLAVFYKQYEFAAPDWKFIGRASKARREFDNYEVFTRLGIPAAEAIACGEERDAIGRLRRAFILTRAIPNALNLKEFFERHCASRVPPASRKVRLQLLRQLAEMTRKIHSANFFHHDLVWRNILATETPDGGAKLWWIDCPRGQFDRWSPLRHHRRLKDLASLDKVASQLCTAAERLHFVKLYLGKSRLDAEVRKLVGQTLAYRKSRWPEDWNP